MSRTCFFIVLFVSAVGCTETTTITRPTPPETIDVFAASPESTWGGQSFAVGIQSELLVAGELGGHREIRDVQCLADSCVVVRAPSAFEAGGTAFLVTPKSSEFDVAIDVAPIGVYGPSHVERHLHAESGELVVVHEGPAPGVPFLSGMHIVWWVGTRAKHIAWEPKRLAISVTPPFKLASAPSVGMPIDSDAFARVEIVAPSNAEVTRGSLDVTTGGATTSFPLVAVPSTDIAKLHVAAAPDSFDDQRTVPELPLDALVRDDLTVSVSRTRHAWLVFETKDGQLGIAGTGECLPSADSVDLFDITHVGASSASSTWGDGSDTKDFPSADRPLLELRGRKRGTGELLLAVGDVTGSAQILVSEAF